MASGKTAAGDRPGNAARAGDGAGPGSPGNAGGPAAGGRTPAGGGTGGGSPFADDNETAGGALTGYLREQATAFLRGMSLRGESEYDADHLLRRSARRIAGVLHTYAPLTDPSWSEPLRAELGWLSATLGREPQYVERLTRLLEALRRLSLPAAPEPIRTEGPGGGANGAADTAAGGGPLALGAARAAALLERQLTLARTRAHSATLQAMGSSRFHGLADSIAVLASDVPLSAAGDEPAAAVLPPLAGQAYQRLSDAADALPLHRAANPYNAEAMRASLGAELTADLQDSPWQQVRILLRLSRYAAEVPGAGAPDDPRTAEASLLLQRHREAAESAAAVAAAARTPRIAPATAYALGVLHADQRHEVEAARFAFSRLWQWSATDPQAAQPPVATAAPPGARLPGAPGR
ncbi:CHAD domain-containing protein [Streptomyces polygonati]|uniref:CHAD domain-containing protein n=1 Tax=Streptomyces polygonati TaxID=1617087 RepID=A0ABV8HDL3_9ACTN